MKPKILVGTSDGLHVASEPRSVEFAGREVRSLVRTDAESWAIVDKREVSRKADKEGWQKMATTSEGAALCLLPTETGVFVGGAGAHLFRLRGGTLESVPSFDHVKDRDGWSNPAGAEPDVRSMSTDPDGIIYVNVHVGGIARSTDVGASWHPTIRVQTDVHQVLYDRGSRLLFGASLEGLAVSEDHGETWRFDTEGLHASYLRAVTVARGTVLVTASTGPYTSHAAVYRRPVHGRGRFERCTTGIPKRFSANINTFNLASAGSCVAFASADGSVFHSENEGESWVLVADSLAIPRSVAFARTV